ncbi:hypothetical protein ABGB07_34000 [Micromonosporaceae bacterium B7E4]
MTTGGLPKHARLLPEQEYGFRQAENALTLAESYDKRWQELHDEELAALDKVGDPTVPPGTRHRAAGEAVLAGERREALEEALQQALTAPEEARAEAVRTLFGGAPPTRELDALVGSAKAKAQIVSVRDLGPSAELADQRTYAENELRNARTAAAARADLASAHVDAIREGLGGHAKQLDQQLGVGESERSLRRRLGQVVGEQRRHEAELKAKAKQLFENPQQARAEAGRLRQRPPRRLFPAEKGQHQPGLAGTTSTVGELFEALQALAPAGRVQSVGEPLGSAQERYDGFRQALVDAGWQITEKPSFPAVTAKVPWIDVSSGLGVLRSAIGGEKLQIKHGSESFEATHPDDRVRIRMIRSWTELQRQSGFGLDTAIAAEVEKIGGEPRSITLVDFGPPENNVKVELKFPVGTVALGPSGKGDSAVYSKVRMEVLDDPDGIVDKVTPRRFRDVLDDAQENLGTVDEKLSAEVLGRYTRIWPGIKLVTSLTGTVKASKGIELDLEKFAIAVSPDEFVRAAVSDTEGKVSLTLKVAASVPGTTLINHNVELGIEGKAKDLELQIERVTGFIKSRFERGQYQLDESMIIDALKIQPSGASSVRSAVESSSVLTGGQPKPPGAIPGPTPKDPTPAHPSGRPRQSSVEPESAIDERTQPRFVNSTVDRTSSGPQIHSLTEFGTSIAADIPNPNIASAAGKGIKAIIKTARLLSEKNTASPAEDRGDEVAARYAQGYGGAKAGLNSTTRDAENPAAVKHVGEQAIPKIGPADQRPPYEAGYVGNAQPPSRTDQAKGTRPLHGTGGGLARKLNAARRAQEQQGQAQSQTNEIDRASQRQDREIGDR